MSSKRGYISVQFVHTAFFCLRFLFISVFRGSRPHSSRLPATSSAQPLLQPSLLLRFQGCHFFFGLLQSSLLLFQCILLLLNRFLDGCDFRIQRRNSLLLLHNLGCVVVISFGTVFTAFRSGPSDNLFPFIVV